MKPESERTVCSTRNGPPLCLGRRLLALLLLLLLLFLLLLYFPFRFPPGDDPPDQLDEPADHERPAEGHREPHHGHVLERLAADPAGEERVGGPDDARYGRGDGEAPPRVPDESAAEGHRGPPAGDEPADDDESHAVPVQRALRPGAPGGALLAGEEPSRRPRPEAPPDQV